MRDYERERGYANRELVSLWGLGVRTVVGAFWFTLLVIM